MDNGKATQELRRYPTQCNLGAFQQAWHMAMAACTSLGLEYEQTSPDDISEAIAKLKRGEANGPQADPITR